MAKTTQIVVSAKSKPGVLPKITDTPAKAGVRGRKVQVVLVVPNLDNAEKALG